MNRTCQMSTVRRASTALAVVLAITALPGASFADPPPWEPMAVPAEVEGPVEVLTLAIDASGSMRDGRALSPRARSAGRHAIAEAGRCAYVVVALFGSEARVAADRFVCTDHDRQVLLDAVESIPMNASHTDVNVLEALLSHVQDALAATYARRGFHVVVQVLTDGEPDPIDPASTQTFDVILEQNTSRTDLGQGLLLYQLDFDHPAPAHGAAVPGALLPPVAEPLPHEQPAPPLAPAENSAGNRDPRGSHPATMSVAPASAAASA